MPPGTLPALRPRGLRPRPRHRDPPAPGTRPARASAWRRGSGKVLLVDGGAAAVPGQRLPRRPRHVADAELAALPPWLSSPLALGRCAQPQGARPVGKAFRPSGSRAMASSRWASAMPIFVTLEPQFPGMGMSGHVGLVETRGRVELRERVFRAIHACTVERSRGSCAGRRSGARGRSALRAGCGLVEPAVLRRLPRRTAARAARLVLGKRDRLSPFPVRPLRLRPRPSSGSPHFDSCVISLIFVTAVMIWLTRCILSEEGHVTWPWLRA